jgi:hypothetical protein
MKANLTSSLALVVLGLSLTGCPGTGGGDSGMMEPDGGCSGVIGCVCAGGACTTGECLGNSCVDCRRGEAACICRANSTCNAGLRCNTGGSCEVCPAGDKGCACATGDMCGAGLVCNNAVCVDNTCTAGTATCPCRAGAPRCDTALYCDGLSLCQACSNDVPGCPCDANKMCAGTTVCDQNSLLCRAPVTCAELSANGTCLPNQTCTQANGMDAVCVPMSCAPNFKWNGVACVACVSMGCLSEPSCSDLDGGLGTACTAQNRQCVQTGASSACGGCLSGFAQNPAGVCVPVPTCGAVTCAFNQYCNRTGAAPICQAVPCPAGQAMGSGNVCTACMPNPTCTAQGFSGRTWPFKTVADVCLCETLDNYFIIAGGLVTATRCDADSDGWVREEAGDLSVELEPALNANRRCTITTVDRARLFDEYGLSVDVLSCTEGLVKASTGLPDGGTPNGGIPLLADGGLMRSADGGTGTGPDGGSVCSGILPMRLLETARNDIPGSPSGTTAPSYGAAAGRLLEANELNSLTKACASFSGDYNDNKLDDIAEVQGAVAPSRPTPPVDRARLESFAYFLELNSASAANGVLTIRERSRCDAAFPFHYAPDAGSPTPNDAYLVANDKPYWRSCQRNRDPAYASNSPQPGFDFAQYNCAQGSLSCPLMPPAHPVRIAPVDPAVTLFRDHGLCRMGGFLPADGRWRGMNHHSQFKCVNIGPGTAPFDRDPTAFGNANEQLTFNNCVARPCATPGDVNCSSPQGMGAQTRQPVLDCKAQAGLGLTGSVGFAAVNYRPYRFQDTFYAGNTYANRFYRGGCVNEDDDWSSFLCPYPEFTLNKSLSDAQFGRYSCYKYGSNFMWAGTLLDGGSNVSDRATLRWGANLNTSVLGPRPPPDGGL